jgi:cysteine desulfurase/selenocysteine lyase
MTATPKRTQNEMSAEPGGERSWEQIRQDFPVLDQEVNGSPLAYLDNAASSQTPRSVIERMERYQSSEHSNVHRGVHTLSQRATDAYEGARQRIADFINAESSDQCIYTSGATEGINLVMYAWGRANIGEGDEIVISEMEHHANIVPWQMLCEQTGATLRVVEFDERGELAVEDFEQIFNDRTKLVGIVHVSNALGTINPVEEIVELAHSREIPVLVDGCQAVPHMPVDVQDIGADFYAFSGHKMNGPTGIGVLYGRREMLESMPPFQGGGDMIKRVTFEETKYNDLPYKFEAGTPAIMPAVGLGAAVDYLESVGMERIAGREADLLGYATERLEALDGVRIFGRADRKASVISFDIEGVHPHDIGTIVDDEGVAIRAGHHCAQPVMDHFGIPATARASLSYYNTTREIDQLVKAIDTVKDIFGK